jgi:hypothetical protein
MAIQAGEEGPEVLTGTPEKPRLIPVQTGLDNGKAIEIVSGLVEGDSVLLKQAATLKKKTKSGSPFMPSRGGRGGGKR